MNVLEIHPWGSTNLDLEHPDRIIFDLDPDEAVSWPTLCEGALEVRERLKKLGLHSFVKTTGGKGLHVVAPIRPTLEWERIKAFTHAFTLQMEQDNSKLYISKMTKAARKNKIFVDYLRNEREATAVAPYSSRARLGMAAAFPLEWAELKSVEGAQVPDCPSLLIGASGCARIRGRRCCRVSRRYRRGCLRQRTLVNKVQSLTRLSTPVCRSVHRLIGSQRSAAASTSREATSECPGFGTRAGYIAYEPL